ncbi:MAG: DUF1800 family protein, partial [Armatimonadota bacterium]
KGKFTFDPVLHDQGKKQVLGKTIGADGSQDDGDRVLDLVATHPSTARHISRKLCRYFLGDSSGIAEDAVTKAFLDSKGDIKTMLRAMYSATKGAALKPQVRRPFDFMVATLRVMGADTDGGRALLDYLTKMGHARFEWPMPDGYPVRDDAWTGSMVGRWRFVNDLLQGRIDGTHCDIPRLTKLRQSDDPVELVAFASKGTPAHHNLTEMVAGLDQLEKVGLVLCSPEFQWK